MTDTNPTVSIVLPTYNRLPLLQKAVASVLAQTFRAWELIIVDDGSEDGTADWVRTLTDPRIRLLESEHCGLPARLRNQAIRPAHGAYIAFLDSDDRWQPDKLSTQLEALTADPHARWSYTAHTLIDATGRTLDLNRAKPWTPISGWITEHLLVHDAIVSLPTVLAERALLDEAGGFNESLAYCEDYDLWLRLAERARVLAVPAPLTCIRIHEESHTRGRPEVTATFAEVYQRFGAGHPSRTIQKLCRKQQQRYTYYYAYQTFAEGDRRQGWVLLREAFRLGLRCPRCWWTLAKFLFWSLKPTAPEKRAAPSSL